MELMGSGYVIGVFDKYLQHIRLEALGGVDTNQQQTVHGGSQLGVNGVHQAVYFKGSERQARADLSTIRQGETEYSGVCAGYR